LACGPFLSTTSSSIAAGFVLAIVAVRATKRAASFSRTSAGRSCHASGGSPSPEFPPSLASAPDSAPPSAEIPVFPYVSWVLRIPCPPLCLCRGIRGLFGKKFQLLTSIHQRIATRHTTAVAMTHCG
jgi:hypothetical protein